MSSIRRKPGTRFWVCCYTDVNGLQRQRSSKTTDRRQAERMAWNLEEAYRRKMTESQLRRILSDTHEELHGRPINDVPLGKYLREWLGRIKPEVERGTHDRYSDAIDALLAVKPEVGAKLIERVEPKDLIDARNALLGARSAGTVNMYLKVYKMAFRAAWQDGLVSENPAARVPPAKSARNDEDTGRRAFTLSELRALLAKADDEWRGIILASLYTGGQRLGDVVRLTPAKVDFDGHTVAFGAKKTKRWNVLPMVAALESDLRARVKGVKPSAPIFPRAWGKLTDDGKVNRLSSEFARLLYRAGLRDNPKTAKARVEGQRAAEELTFHSLRHTFTSLAKRAGAAPAVVMDIAGHESEAVSKNYTHIDDAAKRAALETLPDLTAA